MAAVAIGGKVLQMTKKLLVLLSIAALAYGYAADCGHAGRMSRPVTVTGAEPYTVDLGPQTVVSFVHDRKPMLARTDLERTGSYDLGAYGWCAVLEDGTEIMSEEMRK